MIIDDFQPLVDKSVMNSIRGDTNLFFYLLYFTQKKAAVKKRKKKSGLAHDYLRQWLLIASN